jgi:hypothetical protein
MAELKIKSNGLRNELKEIRKSIDSLTNAIIAQTHARYEKSITNGCTNCNCKNNVLQDDV